MKQFDPIFKDDKDRLIALAMFILSIFAIFIPALVVIFIPKNYISENTYNIAKTLFNFELLLFLISLLFVIPVIGWIAGFILTPVLMIFNVIIIIINLCAIAGNNLIKIPEPYKFI
jgi:hypothetical protein